MDNRNSTLSDFIRSEIDKPGRSENWLAEQTGIARVTLRRRLTQPEGFTLDELIKIGRILDVAPSKLSALQLSPERTSEAA